MRRRARSMAEARPARERLPHDDGARHRRPPLVPDRRGALDPASHPAPGVLRHGRSSLRDGRLPRGAAEGRRCHPRALARVDGLSSYALQRYSPALLQAVQRGRAAPQASAPRPHLRREAPLDNSARARLGRLKEWRKRRASERGVAPDVIVSNEVLYAAARKNPRTLDALVEASGLGPWKAGEYGEEMLAVLHGKKK